MNLAEQLHEQITNTPDPNKRSRLRCRLAKEFQDSGDYEGAHGAMGEIWQRVGERPQLEGLGETERAEVILRVGALTGWIGSAAQFEGAQEAAKDLISESMRLFEVLQDAERLDEGQLEIALCSWRQGAFDKARDILQELTNRLARTGDLYKLALLHRAMIERSAKRYHDALRIHIDAAQLFDEGTSDALRAKFHNGFAITLDILGTSEKREGYIDHRALLEYTAASFHFEQAGHRVYCACVENNLAMLYLAIGRHSEAHEHLDRARSMFASMKDYVHIAQVNETRAKVLLSEGRNVEAEKVVGAAVQTLEKGDEQSLLAEALTTHGITLARIGHHVRARLTLQRAVIVAEQAGDKAAAGRATLTIIEELSEYATRGELFMLYEQAANRLSTSQHPSITARLITGARLVLRLLKPETPAHESVPVNWHGFSIRKAIISYERMLIERALQDAGGMVTRASELLGYEHHQSLISILNHRHKDLLPARTPVVPRKRSIIPHKK